MNATEFTKDEQQRSYTCINNFLNGSIKKGYTIRIPVLNPQGKMEGYCIQKYDKWNHLVEETFFDINWKYTLKVLITNDLVGNPLRKDVFNAHGQRISNHNPMVSVG